MEVLVDLFAALVGVLPERDCECASGMRTDRRGLAGALAERPIEPSLQAATRAISLAAVASAPVRTWVV